MLRYIDVDKEAVPYKFDMRLSNATYTLEINYNAEHDFFTMDLHKGEIVLVLGEKIVYGSPLFKTVRNNNFPDEIIIPLDISGKATEATYENLNDTVLLYIFERSELNV